MCVVSMVGDYYNDKWTWPRPATPVPTTDTVTNIFNNVEVSREEFDKLKAEVLEMKELLKRAKIYDEENDQHDCEQEAKIELLRKVADAVGVDLDEIFGR